MRGKKSFEFSGSIGGNVGKSGGSIGGNVGKSGGAIGGNVGKSGGSIGGSTGESGGSIGGRSSYGNNSNSDCIIVESLKEKNDIVYIFKLREWRDEVLANTLLGKIIINKYYKISPKMVKVSYKIPLVKVMVRKLAIGVANLV